MMIVDGVAYASTGVDSLELVSVKPLSDFVMIVTFNNHEERLFDATTLFDMPVFAPLKNEDVFKSCKVVDGVATWLSGEIDIAPETMYARSFKYDHIENI